MNLKIMRLLQRGYYVGMNYADMMIHTPGEIIQMWLYKVGDELG